MARYLADTNLAELLPSSIASDAGMLAAAEACQPELADIVAAMPNVLVYHNLAALPDEILDLVAWGWHADGYDLVETRSERLDLVRRFFDFHRFKGTKYGLALYLRTFLKRELLAASPPSKSFCGASLTDVEREAWSANFPELRVYPYRHAGTKQGAVAGDFAGATYPALTDAILRIGDQVALYDPLDGSEIQLDSLVTERDVAIRTASRRVPVAKPGSAGRCMFAGRGVGVFATADTGASSRLYALDLAVGYEDEIARRRALSVRPSLTPVKIGSDEAAAPGTRGFGIFLGHPWPDAYAERAALFVDGRYPARSSAGDRIYRYSKLFDASRAVFSRRETSSFLGAFRLGGLRPHHAEAAVDMLRADSRRAMFCGRHLAAKHACDLDARSWVDRMRRVGRMAMRFSDRILVSTANRICVTASEAVSSGSVVCGEYQLEAY